MFKYLKNNEVFDFFYMTLMINSLSAQSVDSISIKKVDSLIKVSYNLAKKREFDKAMQVNYTAEKLALEKFGKESERYSNCCNNRGQIEQFKNDYAEAEKW